MIQEVYSFCDKWQLQFHRCYSEILWARCDHWLILLEIHKRLYLKTKLNMKNKLKKSQNSAQFSLETINKFYICWKLLHLIWIKNFTQMIRLEFIPTDKKLMNFKRFFKKAIYWTSMGWTWVEISHKVQQIIFSFIFFCQIYHRLRSI